MRRGVSVSADPATCSTRIRASRTARLPVTSGRGQTPPGRIGGVNLTCDLCGHTSSDWSGFFMVDPAKPDGQGQIVCADCGAAWHERLAIAWRLFCAAKRARRS